MNGGHVPGLEASRHCFNLLIAYLPDLPPVHFSCGEYLNKISSGLDWAQYSFLDSGIYSSQDFARNAARLLFRHSLFLKTGLPVHTSPSGLPALGGAYPISISYGSNLACCGYSHSPVEKISLDVEAVSFQPQEFSALQAFLRRLYPCLAKKTFKHNERSKYSRLWTIYEAFYKLLPDKMEVIRLLDSNGEFFLSRCAGAAYSGKRTYYFHSFPLKGHWLTLVGRNPGLLDKSAFNVAWLNINSLISLF